MFFPDDAVRVGVSAAVLGERGTRRDHAAAQMTNQISVPLAITVLPDEPYRAPET